ncbi:hypothetical protein ACEZDB_21015 [Streptacidiphilus sp. N1-3]|uniref:Uncharacterized protein n=1 Tax=Streptacidiphilus alkalitolerans TaxID=3342712 RepID=A0ABV6X4J0_9ACTN
MAQGHGHRAVRRPRLLAWYEPGTERDGGVGWSLLAGNGRELARGAGLYRTDRELGEAMRELRADRHALHLLVLQRQGRFWTWVAHLPGRRSGVREGAAIACSARTYLRQDQCRNGLAGFLAALEQLRPADWEALLPGPPKR